MGIRSNVVIVLASLCLFACGSAKNGGEAKGPESNPWADYKGTYATAGTPSTSARSSKVAKAEEPAPAPAPEETAVAEEPAPAAAPPPAKKAKGGGKAAKKKK
jgi:hypothetical protein